MVSKYRKVFRVTTLVVTLAVMHTFVGMGLTSSLADGSSAGVTAVLTTSGNKPVMVNDASTFTGATILNGDSIETPAEVGGMISIPGHGRLEITPNAKLTLGLDSAGNLKVNLLRGCVTMSTIKGTTGEVYNSTRTLGITEAANDASLNVCPEVEPGGAPQIAGNSWSNKATGIVIGVGIGVGLILYFSLRNNNPSPSTP